MNDFLRASSLRALIPLVYLKPSSGYHLLVGYVLTYELGGAGHKYSIPGSHFSFQPDNQPLGQSAVFADQRVSYLSVCGRVEDAGIA